MVNGWAETVINSSKMTPVSAPAEAGAFVIKSGYKSERPNHRLLCDCEIEEKKKSASWVSSLDPVPPSVECFQSGHSPKPEQLEED